MRQDLYVTLVGLRENTHKYLIGRPAEKSSLKGLDVDAKELLEWFVHEDSIGVDRLALAPDTAVVRGETIVVIPNLDFVFPTVFTNLLFVS